MAKKRKSETPAVGSGAMGLPRKSFEFLDAHGAGFNSHPHHAHQPHHKAC